MLVRAAILFASFVVGALLVAVPFFIRAQILNAEELARRQQTMGPGIIMFVGLLLAPFGGLVALIIAVLVQWKYWWHSERSLPPLFTASSVACDEASIEFHWTDQATTRVRWEDVTRVVIRTTDAGPIEDDAFFVVVSGDFSGAVSQRADGAEQLLQRLQQLPGFDNHAVIESMGCTENREFPCWHRDHAIAASDSKHETG